MTNIITNPTDRRLDRLPEFDARNFQHPITALLPLEAKYKPRSYTWRCKSWLDQGQEGACVGFAFTHELAARPAEVIGLENDHARKVYKTAQTLDIWPGENYEGTSVLAGAKAIMQLYPKAYQGYKWAFNMNEVIQTLGYFGPIVLGINWYTGMFSPDADGYIKVKGSIAGGHAILANAINVRKERIHLRNSWGKDWGKNGGCYISFSDLERLLSENGDACVPVGRGIVHPQLTPEPVLIDSIILDI